MATCRPPAGELRKETEHYPCGCPVNPQPDQPKPCTKPPCDCRTCHEHWRTEDQQDAPSWDLFGKYTKICSRKEGEAVVRNEVHCILALRKELNKAIDSHGDVIARRCIKRKSPKQRAAMLREAGVIVLKRYDFMANMTVSGVGIKVSYNDPEPWLLPYIDVETFSEEPDKLLGLIDCRARCAAEEFLMVDMMHTRVRWATASVATEYCLCGIILHGESYGTVLDVDNDSIHRGDMVGYPRALVVLKSQRTVLTLLQRIVKKLIHDRDDTNKQGCSDWRQKALVGFRIDAQTAWAFTNISFESPPGSNVDRMVSIAKLRLEEFSDELRLHQTDWPRLREIIKRSKAIRTSKEVWAELCVTELLKQEYHVFTWRFIGHGCMEVRNVVLRCSEQLQQGRLPSQMLGEQLTFLDKSLVEIQERARLDLFTSMRRSVGFQHIIRSVPNRIDNECFSNCDFFLEDKLNSRGA